MMVLQNLQFPPTGEIFKNMYMRYDSLKSTLNPGEQCLAVKKNHLIAFNTYFNFFSYEKWTNYTILDNISLCLRLKGSFSVALTRFELEDGRSVKYVLYGEEVSSGEVREFEFTYPPCPAKGLLAFEITALEKNSEFHGGAYCTDIDEEILPNVNIAICICTYRREHYIANNIDMLNKNVFSNEDSSIKDHLRVYIADNGQTLPISKLETDKIKIFPNLNGGGAAGFARCIIEANADKEKYGITHCILMDDDIIFTHDSLERTYVFLRMLKVENQDCILGGAMLKLDAPNMLHSAGETWLGDRTIFNKIGYDMLIIQDMLKNELEESINHLSWWFCCMPVNENTVNNLPIPIFFQYDDVDFSLRNSRIKKITLTGICLWHESFEKKISASKMEYYAFRNRLIICALHSNSFTKKFMKHVVTRTILRLILTYKYKQADLVLRAVDDYFKGFKWLSEINPEELNDEIMKSTERMTNVRDLPMTFDYRVYREAMVYADKKESKPKKFLRYIMINGLFLKANREVIVPVQAPKLSNFYRAKRVLNYDENSQKGYITEKSLKETFRILFNFLKFSLRIDREFNKTVKQYKEQYNDVITEKFWRKYLGV